MQPSILRSTLLEAIRIRLDESPVVALLGARQVGKTTLAEQIAETWPGEATVFDLEKSQTMESMQAVPERLLAEREGLVIVDDTTCWASAGCWNCRRTPVTARAGRVSRWSRP